MTLVNWIIFDVVIIMIIAAVIGSAIGTKKNWYAAINGLGLFVWFIIFLADLRKLVIEYNIN
jgi:Flp pilus assembly protein protease CpaA